MKSVRTPSVVAILVFALAGAFTASAAPADRDAPLQVSFLFEPVIQKGFGGTAYDLSFPAGSGWTGLSRLEFPELALEAGGTVGITIDRGGRREWLIEAGATHSTFAISGSMNDYDWMQPGSYPRIPFSFTYCDDTTVSWRVSADAAWTVASAGPWLFAAFGMYRYQDTRHVEDTVTGWQYDWSATPYTLSYGYLPDADVLEYSLTSHSLGIGLLGEVAVTSAFSLQLRAAYTPVYVSDRDDHKVRTKLSTAEGWGNGIYANLRARYRLAPIGRAVTPYIALDGELVYYVVDTTQTQYWYGNQDPPTPAGYQVTGVGHVITSLQYGIGLRIGFLVP